MNPISILFIGFAMSTDAFAAAIGKGAAMQHPKFSQAIRAGMIFGVIEGLTPLIGWLLGSAASRYISAWDHWISFGVLLLLGIHMIYASLQSDDASSETDQSQKRHGFWSLAATGFATSIDAMAIGVTLAFLEVNILAVAGVIACTTFTLVTLGIMLGRVIGTLIGKRAEALGGIILIIIGSVILYEHLSGAA